MATSGSRVGHARRSASTRRARRGRVGGVGPARAARRRARHAGRRQRTRIDDWQAILVCERAHEDVLGDEAETRPGSPASAPACSRSGLRAVTSCSAVSTPRRRRSSPSRDVIVRRGRATRTLRRQRLAEATRVLHYGAPAPWRGAAHAGRSTTRTRARPDGAASRRRRASGRPARAAAARNGVGSRRRPGPRRGSGAARLDADRERASREADRRRVDDQAASASGSAVAQRVERHGRRRASASSRSQRGQRLAARRRAVGDHELAAAGGDQARCRPRARCRRRRSAPRGRRRAGPGRAARGRSRARRCCRRRGGRCGRRACSTAPIRRASGVIVVEQGQHGLLERHGQVEPRDAQPARLAQRRRQLGRAHPPAQIEVRQPAAPRTRRCASRARASGRPGRRGRRTAAGLDRVGVTRLFERRLRRRQARDRHAERRAATRSRARSRGRTRPTPGRRRARRRCRS